MKKQLLMMLMAVAIVGCASDGEVQDSKSIVQRTKTNFAAVNQKIYDDNMVLLDGKFQNFTQKDYNQFLQQYRFSKAQEFKQDLSHFRQQEIHPFEKTFIACIYFPKENYTICDDPRCPGVEKSARGNRDVVEKWLQELPWGQCPRSPRSGLPY